MRHPVDLGRQCYLLRDARVQPRGNASRRATDWLLGKIVGLAASGDFLGSDQRVGEGAALPGYLKHVPETLHKQFWVRHLICVNVL